jgi:hypothetical protein
VREATMRLATRSDFVSVARSISRGFLGGFGMRFAQPRLTAFHIFVTRDKTGLMAWRPARQVRTRQSVDASEINFTGPLGGTQSLARRTGTSLADPEALELPRPTRRSSFVQTEQ